MGQDLSELYQKIKPRASYKHQALNCPWEKPKKMRSNMSKLRIKLQKPSVRETPEKENIYKISAQPPEF